MEQFAFKIGSREELLVQSESKNEAIAKAIRHVESMAKFPDDLDPFRFVPTQNKNEFRMAVGA